MRPNAAALASIVALLLLLSGCTFRASGEDLSRIELPPGFGISIYARVPGARTMAVLPSGRAVIVGTRTGEVYAAVDADGDREAEEVRTLYRGLREPNGVAWHEGHLYVAERHRIWRVRWQEDSLRNPPAPQVIHRGLPDESHHGTRVLAFGPDGKLYVALGSPCNVCKPPPPTDSIVRLDPGGGGFEVFASGVRNSVGMAFQPASGELYFTDNGADWMGDNAPPDELNHAPRAGLHFGFPWYGGGHARTSQYEAEQPPQPVTFPVVEFGAHVAALGLHFYRGPGFPAAYRNHAFVAQHGSWNRSTPTGYRVMRVRFGKDGKPAGTEVFAQGWLQGRTVSGRPVDVAELDDGSLLVSDDTAGLLYRIRYAGESGG